ncbi:putative YTH domain-containing protein [Helianthus anomalus]
MMPGDKKIANPQLSAAVLKSDACAYFTNRNVIPGKVGILSENVVSSVNAGFGNMKVSEQSVHYPSSICYDHHYPGPSDNHHQLGGSCSCHQNCNGTSYKDNGSPLYYMHSGYNPYAFTSVDPQFSSSECYSMNCARYQDPTSYGSKYTMCSDGSLKSSGINTKRSMTAFDERFPSYLLDMQSRQSTSNISQSVLQSSHLCSLNKLGAACHSGSATKGYQQCPNTSSFGYQDLFANYSMIHAPKIRESEELTCGPRAQSTMIEHNEAEQSLKNKYNLDGFQTKYEEAKFFIIKSYSEDDVHKCVKYDVWSSTPNGNKKLDDAFLEAQGKSGSKCPVFLFFSVNGSGQFVGVAEMMGPVVFEKNMDFWQLDKWSGFFPVKWHIIKDIPNSQLRHIILENNDNRPVTYTRDTQEVGLHQGLEMLDIFKSYPSKTSLLDDLSFYEKREKLLKARRIGKLAFQPENNTNSGKGSMSTNGSLDPVSSIIHITRNLSLKTDMPKDRSL